MSANEKLRALGITLPELTAPVGAFLPFVRVGHLLFLAGHVAKRDLTARYWNGVAVGRRSGSTPSGNGAWSFRKGCSYSMIAKSLLNRIEP